MIIKRKCPYRRIKGKLIFLSHIIIKEYLEREIEPNECVHHIDKNPQNNNIENLQVMMKSEHASMHNSGRHCSEKTRKKLRQAQLGKCLSEETRKKIGQAQIGNKRTLGYHHSPEARTKMSQARIGNQNSLGYHHSEESRAKMSQARIGRCFSTETRTKMSIAKKEWWQKRKEIFLNDEFC